MSVLALFFRPNIQMNHIVSNNSSISRLNHQIIQLTFKNSTTTNDCTKTHQDKALH